MPSKYEREIEEILQRSHWGSSRFPNLPIRLRRRIRLPSTGLSVETLAAAVSPTLLVGLSAALALLAVVLQGVVPDLRIPLVIASVGCFLMAFVVAAVSRRAARQRSWRGRDIVDGPPSFEDWLRHIRGKDRGGD